MFPTHHIPKIKMAFNKVSMVLLVLLFVAIILADARVDHLEASSNSYTAGMYLLLIITVPTRLLRCFFFRFLM